MVPTGEVQQGVEQQGQLKAAAGLAWPFLVSRRGVLNSVDAGRQLKIARQLRFEHALHQRSSESVIDFDAAMTAALARKIHIATVGDGPRPPGGSTFQCPKVRFGRTELRMPIIRWPRPPGTRCKLLEAA